MNEKDIKLTKPKQDCVFCSIMNFVDFHGNNVEEYYAQCTNQKRTNGLSVIDITLEGNPLLAETSCHHCNEYNSKNQLSLFQ